MAQYIVTLQAPATVQGAVTVEAQSEDEARKKALERTSQVVWVRTGTEESKATVVRSYQVPSKT